VNGFAVAVVLDGMDLTDAQLAVIERMFRPRATCGDGTL
jgi:hypothetical protein